MRLPSYRQSVILILEIRKGKKNFAGLLHFFQTTSVLLFPKSRKAVSQIFHQIHGITPLSNERAAGADGKQG
jgi:hypothetical protein